jgi:ABC-type multidrug transport system fused ATPase/permease subunit
MSNGEIVEYGSHTQLLQNRSVYASLWATQQKSATSPL